MNDTNNMNNANNMNNFNNINGMNNTNGMNMPNAGMNPQVNTNGNMQADPMKVVSNLNKEEAMEEALSHTNQYSAFEMPKQEVIEQPKKENPKTSYVLIVIIAIIMALFIAFLPQISKLFLGW